MIEGLSQMLSSYSVGEIVLGTLWANVVLIGFILVLIINENRK